MARRSEWWLQAYPGAPTPTGAELRAARKAAKLSAAALAARMGVGRARVSVIEASAEPDAATITHYRAALGSAADARLAQAAADLTAAVDGLPEIGADDR
jgi:transcriptional regulator with XRE-family HTH domain